MALNKNSNISGSQIRRVLWSDAERFQRVRWEPTGVTSGAAPELQVGNPRSEPAVSAAALRGSRSFCSVENKPDSFSGARIPLIPTLAAPQGWSGWVGGWRGAAPGRDPWKVPARLGNAARASARGGSLSIRDPGVSVSIWSSRKSRGRWGGRARARRGRATDSPHSRHPGLPRGSGRPRRAGGR